MPLLRYKTHGHNAEAFYAHRFNVHAMAEVDTGDDSVFISYLEVFVVTTQMCKSLDQAFKDKDVIPDNYNEWFDEPMTEEGRERGYFL